MRALRLPFCSNMPDRSAPVVVTEELIGKLYEFASHELLKASKTSRCRDRSFGNANQHLNVRARAKFLVRE
jgi:hypothetical protein